MERQFRLESFPPEMLLRIFKDLSFRDLCTVIQTSKRFYEAGSDPSLWANATLCQAKVVSAGLLCIKSIPRYKLIKRLDLCGAQWLTKEKIITILTESIDSKLEELILESINLEEIPSELLAKAVSRLKSANLYRTQLRSQQLEQILTQISNKQNFQEIDLGMIDMRKVDVALALSLASLRKVNLRMSRMLDEFITAFLLKSIDKNTLEELNLEHINMANIDISVVSKSLARLKKLYLKWSRLNEDQTKSLFLQIKAENQLEVLCVDNIDIFYVIPVITEAICNSRLKNVALVNANLSHTQCHIIFSKVKGSKLETLNVHGANLRLLHSSILTEAVNHLICVDLWKTQLTTNQCVDLLQNLPLSNTLEYLNLGHVNLSQVPPHLLANAFRNLYRVNLTQTNLTSEQCSLLISSLGTNYKLKDINMTYVNLRDVDPKRLARAVSSLFCADLSFTDMRVEQYTELFETCIEKTSLSYLALCSNFINDCREDELFAQLFPILQGKIKKIVINTSDLRKIPTL